MHIYVLFTRNDTGPDSEVLKHEKSYPTICTEKQIRCINGLSEWDVCFPNPKVFVNLCAVLASQRHPTDRRVSSGTLSDLDFSLKAH